LGSAGSPVLTKSVAIVVGEKHLCVVHQKETIVGRHGGWADYVRAQARFAVPIPDNRLRDRWSIDVLVQLFGHR